MSAASPLIIPTLPEQIENTNPQYCCNNHEITMGPSSPFFPLPPPPHPAAVRLSNKHRCQFEFTALYKPAGRLARALSTGRTRAVSVPICILRIFHWHIQSTFRALSEQLNVKFSTGAVPVQFMSFFSFHWKSQSTFRAVSEQFQSS